MTGADRFCSIVILTLRQFAFLRVFSVLQSVLASCVSFAVTGAGRFCSIVVLTCRQFAFLQVFSVLQKRPCRRKDSQGAAANAAPLDPPF